MSFLRGAAPLLLFAAAVAVIGPRREFPLDDDWTGFLCVRHLLKDGVLRTPDIVSPTLVAHVLWGSLFAKALGLSHTVLRLSTLALALPALLLADGLLLAANPLFFLLSFTYMTDVPYLAWSLLCYAAFWRAWKTDDAGWWLAGSSAAGAAFLIRQTGLCLPAGMALFLLMRGRLTPRRLAMIAAPAAAVFLGYGAWLHAAGANWASRAYILGGTFRHLSSPKGFLWDVYFRGGASALYLCLFTLPHAFSLWAEQGFRTPSPKRTLLCLAALVPLLLKVNAFPFFSGVISDSGLGTPTVSGLAFKNSGLLGSVWFLAALTIAAILGLLTWAATAERLAEELRTDDVLFLACPCLLQWLASLIGLRYFDRYLLMLLPATLLLASRCAPQRGKAFWAGWALLFSWSFLGTWDYLNWNQAKWDAGRAAGLQGYPPEKILNGLDWGGIFLYEDKMAKLKKEKPLDRIGEWEWIKSEPFLAATSFSPYSQFPKLLEVSYRTPLSFKPGTIYVYRGDKVHSLQ